MLPYSFEVVYLFHRRWDDCDDDDHHHDCVNDSYRCRWDLDRGLRPYVNDPWWWLRPWYDRDCCASGCASDPYIWYHHDMEFRWRLRMRSYRIIVGVILYHTVPVSYCTVVQYTMSADCFHCCTVLEANATDSPSITRYVKYLWLQLSRKSVNGIHSLFNPS